MGKLPLQGKISGLRSQLRRGSYRLLHVMEELQRRRPNTQGFGKALEVLSQLQRGSYRLLQGLEELTPRRLDVRSFRQERPLVFFSVIGLVIRFALAPFFGHPYDLRIFMAVSWAVAHGVSPYSQYLLQEIFQDMAHPHLYGVFYGIGYPPPWGLILGFMYQLSSLIRPDDIYILVLCLKIPIIVSDLVASLVIHRILKREVNEAAAFKVFRFYQLCPFAIIIGAVWGMFDVLVLLLCLLAAYWLLEKTEWSLFALGAACAFKLYPVVLAPLYSIFLYRRTHSVKKAGRYSLGVAGLLALMTLIPMAMFRWPVSNLYYAMASHMSSTNPSYNGEMSYTYGAASPFNLYNVFQLINPTVKPPGSLNYLWIAALVALYLYALRRITEIDFRSIVNWSFVVILAFFTTRFWVSEQNLILLFSLFLLVVLLNGNPGDWKQVHAVWILLFTFVVIHVPVTAFLWIPAPQSLDLAVAQFEGSLGAFRQVMMSGLTLSWLTLLWNYFLRRPLWW
jgi:hypothetical protein